MKVAKWEYRRNMKNKSFIIGLFVTPLLFLLFFNLPSLFDDSEEEEAPVSVYVYDELNVWDSVQSALPEDELSNWSLMSDPMEETEILDELANSEKTAYLLLTEEAIQNGSVKVYMSEDVDENLVYQARVFEQPLVIKQLESLGLSEEEVAVASQGVTFESVVPDEKSSGTAIELEEETPEEMLQRIVPIAFGGVILFSILITGMMIFQSASQEKKEKVAEIVLSSLTPEELMKGKIWGYFALGITQVAVWMALILPFLMWKIDLPLLEYILVPETLLSVAIAICGYLLFASIFVGIGATVEDISSTSNFQGILFMFPFLPFVLIAPIMGDPSGIIAQVGTFFPLTTPGVLLLRLAVLDTWPWIEIIIALVVLVITIWFFMKLAGKIFKTGILMYGKDATPKEIWKWLRQ